MQHEGQHWHIPGLITIQVGPGGVIVKGILHDTDESQATCDLGGFVDGDRRLFEWAKRCGQAVARLKAGVTTYPNGGPHSVMVYASGVYVRGPHPRRAEFIEELARVRQTIGKLKEKLVDGEANTTRGQIKGLRGREAGLERQAEAVVECRAEESDGRMEITGFKELLLDASRPHTLDTAVKEIRQGRMVLYRSDEESSAMELLEAQVRADGVHEAIAASVADHGDLQVTPEEAIGNLVDQILAP